MMCRLDIDIAGVSPQESNNGFTSLHNGLQLPEEDN